MEKYLLPLGYALIFAGILGGLIRANWEKLTDLRVMPLKSKDEAEKQ